MQIITAPIIAAQQELYASQFSFIVQMELPESRWSLVVKKPPI